MMFSELGFSLSLGSAFLCFGLILSVVAEVALSSFRVTVC